MCVTPLPWCAEIRDGPGCRRGHAIGLIGREGPLASVITRRLQTTQKSLRTKSARELAGKLRLSDRSPPNTPPRKVVQGGDGRQDRVFIHRGLARSADHRIEDRQPVGLQPGLQCQGATAASNPPWWVGHTRPGRRHMALDVAPAPGPDWRSGFTGVRSAWLPGATWASSRSCGVICITLYLSASARRPAAVQPAPPGPRPGSR